ncbi:MAG: PTS sugar transporter subunit IIA [Planctomycetota bacterium]|jgi:mannitol/fructose-specific phosphotransferase system IIA component (Ntr-type)
MSQPRKKEKTVRDLVPPDIEVVHVESTSKPDVVRELLSTLVAQDVIDLDREREIRTSILEREKVASTGIGNGVALPHGKSKHAKKLGVTVGLSAQGVEFDAHDQIPAYVIVMWVCEPRQVKEHLALMRGLATVAKDPNRAGELAAVRDRRQFLDFLGTIPLDEKEK